jgi:hypothetical protein
MSWAVPPQPSTFHSASVRFADLIDLRAELGAAEASGLLPVLVASPGPAWRGRLALVIEEAVETALLRRGACPSGVGAATSLEGSLADQLYRARLLELRGVALGVCSLAGIATLSGVLDAEDSAVLRWWLDACDRAPVQLVLDRANATLGVYGPPRPLAEIMRAPEAASVAGEGSRVLAPEVGASVAAMELSEPPPAVLERDGALAFEQPGDEDDSALTTAAPPVESALAENVPAAVERVPSLLESAPPQVERSPIESAAAASESAPRAAGASELRPVEAEATRPLEACAENGMLSDRMESLGDITEAILKSLVGPRAEPPPLVPPAPAPRRRTKAVDPETTEDADAVSILVPPLYPNARDEWPAWASDLSAARGAKPLAAIERMFVSSYVPLSDAVLRGIADGESAGLVARWAASFARSYEEAFDALRVRGKRPTMVLDAPDIALRIGRLHGARSVQLLLIDALRYDLGLRVEQRVRALLGQQAALAERLLLWSALPSTTEVQLELIGRGAEGLAEPTRGESFEVPVARGRAAASLRRVKTGHRELLKLDLVEARLSEPGPPELERLDALADETARVLADYLSKQAPRTLVLAFGDHGFLLDRLDAGATRAARHGGSSPEEVLVPAFAWLVGGVH